MPVAGDAGKCGCVRLETSEEVVAAGGDACSGIRICGGGADLVKCGWRARGKFVVVESGVGADTGVG